MSASYFTIVHILVLCVIFILFLLFFVLSLKAESKLFWSLVFTNVLVCGFLSVFLMLVLDKYTKKGVVENIKSQRVLRNESIVFSGEVRNVGRFMISGCTLVIKLINQPLNKEHLKGDTFFQSSGLSLFSWLFKDDGSDKKPNVVEYEFDVARDLGAKKSVPFSVSMPYPPYFSKTMTITKISCY